MEYSKLNFTLPKDIVDAMDRLVEKGIYRDRAEIVREALRNLYRRHGIEPFCKEVAEEKEKSPE